MEKDLIIEGLIIYTRNGKLKWKNHGGTTMSTVYRTAYNISGEKKIFIYFNKSKNINKSNINIDILLSENKLRFYKNISSMDLRKNRFGELGDVITESLL